MGFLTELWQFFGDYANEIRRYLTMLFPELEARLEEDRRPFKAQPGCDIQALYYEYRDNPDGLLKAIPRALTLVEGPTAATGP